MVGPRDKSKYRLRTRQVRGLVKGNLEETSHKVIQTTRAWLSASATWIYSHILFPPNKDLTDTTFRLCVEIHLYTPNGLGPCLCPLVPGGLVARIWCSHCLGLTSVSGWGSKSCLKSLPDQGGPYIYDFIYLVSINCWCHVSSCCKMKWISYMHANVLSWNSLELHPSSPVWVITMDWNGWINSRWPLYLLRRQRIP